MKRELKNAITRIRKAQNAAFAGKTTINGYRSNIDLCGYNGWFSFAVYRHDKDGNCESLSYYLNADTTCRVSCLSSSLDRFVSHHIEEVLTEASNFIGYPI
jgi:hypothetical protein